MTNFFAFLQNEAESPVCLTALNRLATWSRAVGRARAVSSHRRRAPPEQTPTHKTPKSGLSPLKGVEMSDEERGRADTLKFFRAVCLQTERLSEAVGGPLLSGTSGRAVRRIESRATFLEISFIRAKARFLHYGSVLRHTPIVPQCQCQKSRNFSNFAEIFRILYLIFFYFFV